MLKGRRHDEEKTSNIQVLTNTDLKSFEDFEILDDDITDSKDVASLSQPWRVLIVDDEEEIHASTAFALKNTSILGKPIELIHAYSAAEGFEKICNEENITLVLLDVVMESEEAGLKLVEKIRKSGYNELRIVLRTGQPGYAPELSVLSDYDINDYRTKSELTRTRLISLLTTSFRSYRQLHIINESRRGLGLIVESASELFKRKNLELFSQGVLTQLISLLGAPNDGVACLMANEVNSEQSNEEEGFRVVTATGRFQSSINKTLAEISDNNLNNVFKLAKNSDAGIHLTSSLGIYLSSREGKKLFVFVEVCSDFTEEHISLLQVFASNIEIAFENLALIEQLDQLAFIDPILGIPNRNGFEVDFQKYVQDHEDLSVFLVHVNGLSQAISVFGIPVVNQALVTVVKKLERELVTKPLSVSYDGKADLILLAKSGTIDVEQINKVFESRVQVENFMLPLTATISIVKVAEGMDAQDSLRCATSAMILAKSTPGTNLMHYDYSMSQGLTERILLQSALRNSLELRIGVEAYLQPKVKCSDGTVYGAEALCRWTLDGKRIPPCEFIPIAEAGGLSAKLTELMLEEVAEFTQQRHIAELPPIKVAINLSMHDLSTTNFCDELLNKLVILGLSPQTVDFEITESVMMDHPDHTIFELNKLQAAGYSIAIDDFGTGYSSLNYLEKLPVDCLKIDKSFIDALEIKSAKRSLAAMAISVAERMGLYVVAEGIETKEQHDALMFLGCDACQGFYFGEPTPIRDFNNMFQLGEVARLQ